jgi:hypothetical protein
MSHTIEDVYKYVKAIHKCACGPVVEPAVPAVPAEGARGRSASRKPRAETNKTRVLSAKRANAKTLLTNAGIKPSGANLAVFSRLINSGMAVNAAINKTRAAKNAMKAKRANTLASKKTVRKSKSPSL